MVGQLRTDGVGCRELKLEAVDLILVEGVRVEHPYVEEPFFKVVGRHQLDSGREVVVQLETWYRQPHRFPRHDEPGCGMEGHKRKHQETLTLPSSLPSRFAAKLVMALSFLRLRWEGCPRVRWREAV